MTNAPERIWAATPLDGIMKPETMYGWTTAEHLPEWQSENEAEIELGCDDPLVYAEYILATPEAFAASPEVQALIAAERERCIAAVTATCDAEITQAKRLGPMHVPIIIAVKHDCIAAIRETKP